MQAYMRDRFPFLGIPKPRREQVLAPFYATSKSATARQALGVLTKAFALPEREFHYLGIELVNRRHRVFDTADIVAVLPFLDIHAWWDSVDALRKPIGLWARCHRDHQRDLHERLLSGSMWQRRVAITLQLQWKDATDVDLLADAIIRTVGEQEFFIQKAIGWALRDYSKSDRDWVREFVTTAGLRGLALREASKYL